MKYTADQLAEMVARSEAVMVDTVTFPISDAEDLATVLADPAVTVVANTALRQFCIARAIALGMTVPLPAGWNTDGTLKSRTETTDSAVLMATRAYLLDDISIRADGTGRTVVAYAAPFDVPAEIQDQDGHYNERLSPTSFNKSIAERMGQIGCFYNHGRTLFGTPSERFAVPLGAPKEIRADGRGLLTATLYNRTQLADEILDSIKNGDPMGMSFSGRFLPGRSQRTRAVDGGLDTIVRQEIALKEYGPTPTPAYAEAVILGTRSGPLVVSEVIDTIHGLPPEDRRELIRLLDTSRSDTAAADAAAQAVQSAADAATAAATAAGTSTSATNDTPPPGAPVGLSNQRQRRANALALATISVPKGP